MLGEVYDSRRVKTVDSFQINIIEKRIVFIQVFLCQQVAAVRNVKRLAGFVVNLCQYAILIVIEHVNQRRVEYGVIAHQQLLRVGILLILGCHIVFNTQQLGDTSFVVFGSDREVYFVDFLAFVGMLRTA